MQVGLAQTAAGPFEAALSVLGRMLGADARKPQGKGRCDSTWCWNDILWLAIDAKSEHLPHGAVPLKDIRQANDQLRLLAADRNRDRAPDDSATVIVSPKPAVDPDGVTAAEAHVHLVHPDVVVELAHDAETAWAAMLAGQAGRKGDALQDLVARSLNGRDALPSQVADRLRGRPVAS